MTDSTALQILAFDSDHERGLVEAEVLDRAHEYARGSKARNTIKTYGSAWRAFCSWARARRLQELPARPDAVAGYLAARAHELRPSSLQIHLSAIAEAHKLAAFDNPCRHEAVKAVMAGIRRRHGTARVQKAAITVADLRGMLDVAGDDLRGLRDRALLLLGFTAGLRRSELVGLDVDDLDFRDQGIALRVKRSKTDQDGGGRMIPVGHGGHARTCPVVAVRKWLAAASVESGPVFVGIDRHGHVRPGRLQGRAVCRIVQRLGEAVGLEPNQLGGHSLRAGFVTAAATAGVHERDIASVSGHRSVLILRSYVRQATLFDGDLTRKLGL